LTTFFNILLDRVLLRSICKNVRKSLVLNELRGAGGGFGVSH